MAVNQLTTFIPTVWATRLNIALRKNLILANRVNMDYQGNVRPGGTVKITRPTAISVSDYDPTSTTISYGTAAATQQELVINVRKHFAFQIDDLDADLSNVNLVDAYTQEASYSLADAVDQSIADEYANQGAGDVTLDLGSSPDYYAALVDAAQNLDENSAPSQGRWHVTSPAGYAQLRKDAKFTAASDLGDAVVQSGAIGQVAGFDIFVSNNLVDTGSTDVVRATLYGRNSAITHARALTGQPEAMRLEGKFAVGIRGQLAWGNKTIRSDELGTITITE